MPTMRDIKGRIRSVTTTKKTTKAMNLVSSSKMARAKAKLNQGNPFFENMHRIISNIMINTESIEHELFEERKIKRSLIIVIANDRGLCGGYNVNVCKHAMNLMNNLQKKGSEVSIFAIGNKSRDFFNRINIDIIEAINGISESPFYTDAQKICSKIIELYKAQTFDQVHICYTQFVSAISYLPSDMKLMPLQPNDFLSEGKRLGDAIRYEPNSLEVLDYFIPKYISTMIFLALSTSAASGQAATMTAMDSATENAENIIDNLTLMYNRARQGAITQEISEIVGGANALE